MRVVYTTLIALSWATTLWAQVPATKNPSGISFMSPDHALATGYEVDIITAAGAVLSTVTTGRGTQAADGTVTVTFSVQPIAFGLYTLRARTVVGAVKSVSSAPSDPFERAPGSPSKPVLK